MWNISKLVDMISSNRCNLPNSILLYSLDTIKFYSDNKDTALGSYENLANTKITRIIDYSNIESVNRSD